MTLEQLEAKINDHLTKGGLRHSSGVVVLTDEALHTILKMVWDAGHVSAAQIISNDINAALAGKQQ